MLQRILGVILGLAFLVAVLFFASLAFGVLLAAGLLAWTWAWWRRRGLRQAARQTVVIDGEYRDETHLERLSNRP
jgi:TRAP-type C4-dicarboxylate transport system permease large subunit